MGKKKFILMALVTLIFLANISFASAASSKNGTNVDRSVFDQLSALKKAGKIKDSDVPAFLKKAGWTVQSTKQSSFSSDGTEIDRSGISTMSKPAGDYTLTMWTTYNDHARTEWTVFSDWSYSGSNEAYPGTYDMLSYDWDKTTFDYRSKIADTTYFWLADASQALNGTLLWNLKDNAPNFSSYVGLTQKQANHFTSVSIKFVHTYDKTQSSTSYSGSASYSWGGALGIGVSWSVTNTTVLDSWSKANIITMTTN